MGSNQYKRSNINIFVWGKLDWQNYLKFLNQSVDEMKEIIELDNIYHQINNEKYHSITEAPQLLWKKKRLINWLDSLLSRFKSNWFFVVALMERKISGRKLIIMNSLKN